LDVLGGEKVTDMHFFVAYAYKRCKRGESLGLGFTISISCRGANLVTLFPKMLKWAFWDAMDESD